MAEDLEKLPIDNKNKMNRPEGGAYGERVELDRLKKSLPQSSPGSAGVAPPAPQGQVRPTPIDPGAGPGTLSGRRPSPGAPAGVPDVLTAPTRYPNRPVSTPYAPGNPNPQAAQLGASTVQQRRLAVLDALINSPNVGEETKEWAEIVRGALIYGSSDG